MHHIGFCQRIPGRDYSTSEVHGVTAPHIDSFNATCRSCWPEGRDADQSDNEADIELPFVELPDVVSWQKFVPAVSEQASMQDIIDQEAEALAVPGLDELGNVQDGPMCCMFVYIGNGNRYHNIY